MFEFLDYMPTATWVIVVIMILGIPALLVLRRFDRGPQFDYLKPHSFEFSKWLKGKTGERAVHRALKRELDRSEYLEPLKNVWLSTKDDEMTEIDHIVVSVYGIFVIETKWKTGWIYGTPEEGFWTQKFRDGRSKQFQNPLHQNRTHLKALAKIPSIYESTLYSAVVFVGDCKFEKPMPPNVTRGWDHLMDFIRSNRERRLPLDKATELWSDIKKNRRRPSRKQKQAHARRMQRRQEHKRLQYREERKNKQRQQERERK